MRRFRAGRKAVMSALLLALALAAGVRVARAYFPTIDSVVSASFLANDRRTVGLNTNANLPVNAQPATTFTNGTGAGGVQVLYQATRTFSGSSDALNLGTGGGLADSYGTAVALTSAKAIMFNNTGTSSITIGAGSNPITTLLNSTGTLTLPAGAWAVFATPDATGWAITATTACNFNVSGTNGQTYQFIVLGNGT